MKIIFFGTPDFTVPVLQTLVDCGYQVSAVITQPDSEVGRKKALNPPPVKQAAEQLGIKVFQPTSLKDDAFFETFKSLEVGLVIVAGYGRIIPEKYLSIPRYGFLCVHPSLLPKYRGPSPIQTAILNGDKETGVSVMLIDKEMDHGPVLSIEKCELEPTATLQDAEKKLWGLGAQLLIKAIPPYIDGSLKPQEQNHNQATFTKLLTREDGRIDWSKPAQYTYNQIRALNPNPGTWTIWNGKIINIKKAEFYDDKIHIKTIQMEGKKDISFEEFLRGHSGFDISHLK